MSQSYSKALLFNNILNDKTPVINYLNNNDAILTVDNKWLTVYFFQYKNKWFDIFICNNIHNEPANKYFGINIDTMYYPIFYINDSKTSTKMNELFNILCDQYTLDDNYLRINVTNYKFNIIK